MGGRRSDCAWDQLLAMRVKDEAMICANTILLNFPLFCPKYKKENKFNVIKLKMVESKEPYI